MEKFLKYLYWSFLLGFCGFVIYMSTVMFFSPRQDALKRGFIPCTEELVYNLTGCQKASMKCSLKYLWQDMKCNTSVVFNGLGLWFKGKQKSPWANYLYKPVAITYDDAKVPYYDEVNVDSISSRDNFINAKKQELEEAKKRQLNVGILIADPENMDKIADDIKNISVDELINAESGDISDEAYMDKNDNIIDSTQQENAQKIVKGNLKNEN